MYKGFTLIELLIVIAVLGVLAAGVLVAIDPIDKINAANDAKVQGDIGAIGRAMESYAALHNGLYPGQDTGDFADIADDTIQQRLVSSGELKKVLSPPTGYNCVEPPPVSPRYNIRVRAVGDTNNTTFVSCQLKSKRYSPSGNINFWVWCDNKGKANVSGVPQACVAPNGGVTNPW